MTVCFNDLINGISDEVCDDHEVRSVVQKHGDKGVAKVVVSDALYAGLLDVGFKGVGEGILVDGVLPAKEERGFSPVLDKRLAQGGANGCVSDLFVL